MSPPEFHATSEALLKPIDLRPLPNEPLVSVLIATYNYGRYVGEALDSVLAQTYQRYEVVVCDDGSTDGTREIVEAYTLHEPRIKYVYQSNAGVGAALNAAYRESSGEIICLLDADDSFYPRKLELVVRGLAESPDVGLIMHLMMLVDKDGKDLRQSPWLPNFEEGWIAASVVRNGGRFRDMPGGALCFRREVADCVFPIPAGLFRTNADAFVSLTCVLLSRILVIHAPLSTYRIHDSNLTAYRPYNYGAVVTRVISAVNRRMAELGLTARRLDLARRPDLGDVNRCVLTSPFPLARLREYVRFAGRFRSDHFYSRPHKFLLLVVYAIAALLPPHWASRWLAEALGSSTLKFRAQRLLSACLRGPGRKL
jgi:glycosyltransferase involved in cell wall biosynthesis